MILLDVPYYSQRDNVREPWRTCNVSSHAMVTEFLRPGIFNGSDDEYAIALSRYGDTTKHDAHTKLLASKGFNSSWRMDLSYEKLDAHLRAGYPTVIGVLHDGHYLTPYGGHILVVIGKNENGDYIVNDPWGEPFSYKDKNGARRIVPKISLDHRWLCDGPSQGWGRIFYGHVLK